MNINKNNWFARYYNWIYGELPKDVCSFFWGSILSTLLFPLVVPGRLVTKDDNVGKHIGNGILLWIGYFLLTVIGIAVMDKLGYVLYGFWGIFGLGLLIGVGVIAAFLLVLGVAIGGPLYIGEKASDNPTFSNLKQNTATWIGAIRKKHCTKINWL